MDRESCVTASVHAGPIDWSTYPMLAGLGGCPWRVLVGCLLTLHASEHFARQSLRRVLNRWPTPLALAEADPVIVADRLRGIRDRSKRAAWTVEFSKAWIAGQWEWLVDLPHVGMRATDAVRVYCFNGDWTEGSDRRIRRYLDDVRKGQRGD